MVLWPLVMDYLDHPCFLSHHLQKGRFCVYVHVIMISESYLKYLTLNHAIRLMMDNDQSSYHNSKS